MQSLQRGIHLDFHTLPAVPDVGTEFDADEFAATLADAHVTWVTVFAKCNLGMAYYPTRVGVRHPSLQRDLLGEMVEACHRRDIAVCAYLNAGLDHEMARLNRHWVTLDAHGRAYQDDRLDPFFRVMCFGGPWADHLVAMAEEVLRRYPVDGIFLDCWCWDKPCHGNECLCAIRDAGQDPLDANVVTRFQNERRLDVARRIRALIDQLRPGAGYYLNGVPYEVQIDIATHLELESLPAGGWGYMDFPWKVRYLRKWSLPLVRQTGRFSLSWGDFGGLRPQAGLDFDCFQAISHGATCGIGDHLHPCGRLDEAVYRRIGAIFSRVAQLEPWTRDARALTDTAAIIPDLAGFGVSSVEHGHVVRATTRALAELKYQFDLLDADIDWSGYRLLVLVPPLPLDAARLAKLQTHLDAGGSVVAMGSAGLLADDDAFGPGWPVTYHGHDDLAPGFFRVRPELGTDLPDMPLTWHGPAVKLAPVPDAQILADVVEPCFNRHWDAFHGHGYIPPAGPAGRPALTRLGRVVHISFSPMHNYAGHADPAQRDLLGAAMAQVFRDPLVTAEGLPSFARLTLTTQPGRIMVHLVSYVPEQRGQDAQIVEEPVALRDVVISLRCSGTKRVCTAPDQRPLDWTTSDGRVRFVVPEVVGYCMVVVEA